MQINVRKFLSVIFAAIMIVGGAHAAEWTNQGKKLADGRVWEMGAFDIYRQNFGKVKSVIKYYEVCDTKPANATAVCDKDFFAKTNVTAREAWNLAQDYIKNKYETEAICHPSIRQSWNDDYIMCAAIDGSAKYYELRFDDVREAVDKTVQESLIGAICRMYGGDWVDVSNNSVGTMACKTPTEYICNNIGAKMKAYGDRYTSKYVANTHVCQIKAPDASGDSLRTYKDINIYKFRGFQFNNMVSIEYFLKRYVDRVLFDSGEQLTSWNCKKSATEQIKEGFIGKDDILTCYANNHPIDFVFDDLRDARSRKADVATAGLSCLDRDGSQFDGKNCYGFDTPAECIEFGKQIPGGAEWDDVLDTCVLTAAATDQLIGKVTDAATAVVVAGVSVALAIPSGGTSLALVTFTTATSAVGYAIREDGENWAQRKVAEALNKTHQICVKRPLSVSLFVDAIKSIETAIEASDGSENSQWTDTALDEALDECVTGLLEIVNSNQVTITPKEFNEIVQMSVSIKEDESSVNLIKIGRGVEVAAAIMSLAIGGGSAVARATGLSKYAAKFKWLKSANKVSRLNSSVMNSVSKLSKIEKPLERLMDFSSMSTASNGYDLAIGGSVVSIPEKATFQEFIDIMAKQIT